jgi:site-specific DNA-methyltransferase (adenine-specific)/modification methylase
VKPYWTSPDGAIVVYCARWEDVVAAGCVPVREVALVHADPPYGVGERTDRASKGRGSLAPCYDFPAVAGDDRPFDPAPLLQLDRPLVTWGANHYADKLPPSPSWLTWDKRDGIPSNDNADCEHAWSNLGGPARVFVHRWNGMIKASEGASRRCHPTQKPIALCSWVYARAKLRAGNLVFVPYMGSGPDLPACVAAGLRCIAVDCVEDYCRVAVARLGAVTAEVAALPAGPLFAPRQAE